MSEKTHSLVARNCCFSFLTMSFKKVRQKVGETSVFHLSDQVFYETQSQSEGHDCFSPFNHVFYKTYSPGERDHCFSSLRPCILRNSEFKWGKSLFSFCLTISFSKFRAQVREIIFTKNTTW
jgi:hypothetical protein